MITETTSQSSSPSKGEFAILLGEIITPVSSLLKFMKSKKSAATEIAKNGSLGRGVSTLLFWIGLSAIIQSFWIQQTPVSVFYDNPLSSLLYELSDYVFLALPIVLSALIIEYYIKWRSILLKFGSILALSLFTLAAFYALKLIITATVITINKIQPSTDWEYAIILIIAIALSASLYRAYSAAGVLFSDQTRREMLTASAVHICLLVTLLFLSGLGIAKLQQSEKINAWLNEQVQNRLQKQIQEPYVLTIGSKSYSVSGQFFLRQSNIRSEKTTTIWRDIAKAYRFKVHSVSSINPKTRSISQVINPKTRLAIQGQFGTLYVFNSGTFVYYRNGTNFEAEDRFVVTFSFGDESKDLKTYASTLEFRFKKGASNYIRNYITYTGGEHVIRGTDQDDDIYPGDLPANSLIIGGKGDDVISGTKFSDRIQPGKGKNVVFPSGGNDVITLEAQGENIIVFPKVLISSGEMISIEGMAGADDLSFDLRYLIEYEKWHKASNKERQQFFKITSDQSGQYLHVDPDGSGNHFASRPIAKLSFKQFLQLDVSLGFKKTKRTTKCDYSDKTALECGYILME